MANCYGACGRLLTLAGVFSDLDRGYHVKDDPESLQILVECTDPNNAESVAWGLVCSGERGTELLEYLWRNTADSSVRAVVESAMTAQAPPESEQKKYRLLHPWASDKLDVTFRLYPDRGAYEEKISEIAEESKTRREESARIRKQRTGQALVLCPV